MYIPDPFYLVITLHSTVLVQVLCKFLRGQKYGVGNTLYRATACLTIALAIDNSHRYLLISITIQIAGYPCPSLAVVVQFIQSE